MEKFQEDRSRHLQRLPGEFQRYDSLRRERWPKGQSGSALSIPVRRSRGLPCPVVLVRQNFRNAFVGSRNRAGRRAISLSNGVPFLVSGRHRRNRPAFVICNTRNRRRARASLHRAKLPWSANEINYWRTFITPAIKAFAIDTVAPFVWQIDASRRCRRLRVPANVRRRVLPFTTSTPLYSRMIDYVSEIYDIFAVTTPWKSLTITPMQMRRMLVTRRLPKDH